MTQEQIIDAGIDYTMQNYPVCIAGGALADMSRQMNRNTSFETGAKWAIEKLIEEVCEWMIKQKYQEFAGAPFERLFPDEVVKDFKKSNGIIWK